MLGFDDASFYCSGGSTAQHPYFGATIGRVANRIANGSFTLDGILYELPLNDKGVDTVHVRTSSPFPPTTPTSLTHCPITADDHTTRPNVNDAGVYQTY